MAEGVWEDHRGEVTLSVQQVATCVRVSLFLWGGAVGPKFSALGLDTIFVRDEWFFKQLARDLKMGVAGASELYAANRAANEENIRLRRLRGEALVVAEEVCGAVAFVRKNYLDRWHFFEKMVRGQTVRQISRALGRGSERRVADACSWCAGAIEGRVGAARMEPLLTFREHTG